MCLSSAMNVGHPSNLPRIIALYGGMMNEAGVIYKDPDLGKMQEDMFGVSVSDEDTRLTIAGIYSAQNILLEPHGAVAWRGITEYLRLKKSFNPDKQLFISLETAHPAKFPEELRQIINVDLPIPDSLTGLSEKPEKYFSLDNDYDMLKDFILKYY